MHDATTMSFGVHCSVGSQLYKYDAVILASFTPLHGPLLRHIGTFSLVRKIVTSWDNILSLLKANL